MKTRNFGWKKKIREATWVKQNAPRRHATPNKHFQRTTTKKKHRKKTILLNFSLRSFSSFQIKKNKGNWKKEKWKKLVPERTGFRTCVRVCGSPPCVLCVILLFWAARPGQTVDGWSTTPSVHLSPLPKKKEKRKKKKEKRERNQ